VHELTVEGPGGEPVLSDLSFSLGRGQRAAVCGPNGAGKTTLLRCLTGFVRPTRGRIRIFGEEPRPVKLRERVGCLFQNPAKQLFENTVFAEVAFSLKRLGVTGEGLAARGAEALALCDIEDLADCSPHKLSYGQKHLVALASVLAPDPDLLLLDDPFAGLDAARIEAVLRLISNLSEERGTAVLWTVHDPRSLPKGVDFTLHLQGGKDVPD